MELVDFLLQFDCLAKMEITSSVVADIRELAATGDVSVLSGISPTGFSIGAVVELAGIRLVCAEGFAQVLDRWAELSPILRDAFTILESGVIPHAEKLWVSKGIEFYPIVGADWSNPSRYHPFESRFCKATKNAGFGGMAEALVGALFEMADNISQHSGEVGRTPAKGLIGYSVSLNTVSFAIADIGRGCLASLRENPQWADLPNSKSALMAIINQHASRRLHAGDGEGFKEVFRSLANLNGLIELRSNDGRVTVIGTPMGREATSQYCGEIPGFQIAVTCSLTGPVKESIFPVDYLT
ncbi:MAG: hypothetical protein QM813_03405 [Verrucomicrobiota bacterium]